MFQRLDIWNENACSTCMHRFILMTKQGLTFSRLYLFLMIVSAPTVTKRKHIAVIWHPLWHLDCNQECQRPLTFNNTWKSRIQIDLFMGSADRHSRIYLKKRARTHTHHTDQNYSRNKIDTSYSSAWIHWVIEVRYWCCLHIIQCTLFRKYSWHWMHCSYCSVNYVLFGKHNLPNNRCMFACGC